MATARTRYSAGAILFHWIIAGLIVLNIWVGWRMGGLKGLAQFNLFQLHKSIGITVLLLSLLRLGWRMVHRAPAFPASMTSLEKRVAVTVHWLLYAFMIILPLTGWVIVSASSLNLPTMLFKTVPWPHLSLVHDLPMTTRKMVEDRFAIMHAWLAWSLLASAALHAAAALKHHFWDRDDVLMRMVPLLRKRRAPVPTET
ncbi:MAG: cytochrome b [Bradyrhizobium sp.]|nr:cytochrome b [Bradyrhizobium sp.]